MLFLLPPSGPSFPLSIVAEKKKWSGIWGGSIGPQKKRGRINGSNCISQHAMHHASYEINSRIIDAVIHSVYPASSKESRPNAMPYARPGWNS